MKLLEDGDLISSDTCMVICIDMNTDDPVYPCDYCGNTFDDDESEFSRFTDNMCIYCEKDRQEKESNKEPKED